MAGTETTEKAKCALMLYIVADGTLANFAVYSLKQLQAAASKRVVVAAQFSAPERKVRRLFFDGTNKTASLDGNGKLPADLPMDDPKTLSSFIEWAHQECNAERNCLVLWGHGPELLFEPPVTSRKPRSTTTASKTSSQEKPVDVASQVARLYFTPVQLADAVKQAGKKIDLIGLDACSMSMVEFANELHGLVDFMVASQEEVPDFSFPYDSLVREFEALERTTEELCKETVEVYVRAYRDYIFNDDTNTAPVTLSALDLGKIDTITRPLKDLADALRSSASRKDVADAIYSARQQAQGFVGGIFVDLCDFCDKLRESNEIPDELKEACTKVLESGRSEAGCVVANGGTRKKVCHGLSIYFPYLRDEHDNKQIKRDLVKGPDADTIGKGPDADTIGKNVSIVNAAATNALYAVRRKIIEDTENYYQEKGFKFGSETCWREFIVHDWSRILAERERDNLNLRYSAEQCAQNLLSSTQKPEATQAEGEKESKDPEPPSVKRPAA